MDRNFRPDDDGKLFRDARGLLGRLEAPPLTDPGSLSAAEIPLTGILWYLAPGGPGWYYVTAADVTPEGDR